MSSPIEELAARLWQRLEERQTRRVFVGVLGAGAGGGLLAGCRGAFTRDRDAPLPGAYGQGDVAVCYSPMRVVATEPDARARGRTGVFVRKGPSLDAEPTLMNDGRPAMVPEGRHLGRQSRRRSPGPGCRAPALRPAVNGFVWGYPGDDVESNKSGWIPVEVAGVRYAEPNDRYGLRPGDPTRWLCGPRSFDFDCRSEASKRACGYRCGGGGLGRVRRHRRVRRVRDRGSALANNNEEYYLRLALGSTPFWWVAPGDELLELATRRGRSYGKYIVSWSFVEVVRGRFAPGRVRGWLLSSVLEPPARS